MQHFSLWHPRDAPSAPTAFNAARVMSQQQEKATLSGCRLRAPPSLLLEAGLDASLSQLFPRPAEQVERWRPPTPARCISLAGPRTPLHRRLARLWLSLQVMLDVVNWAALGATLSARSLSPSLPPSLSPSPHLPPSLLGPPTHTALTISCTMAQPSSSLGSSSPSARSFFF